MLSDAMPVKSYPRITIDLNQFKDTFGDVDENTAFYVQGRICARTHTDYCNTVEVEVRKISASEPESKVALISPADQELKKLRGRSL